MRDDLQAQFLNLMDVFEDYSKGYIARVESDACIACGATEGLTAVMFRTNGALIGRRVDGLILDSLICVACTECQTRDRDRIEMAALNQVFLENDRQYIHDFGFEKRETELLNRPMMVIPTYLICVGCGSSQVHHMAHFEYAGRTRLCPVCLSCTASKDNGWAAATATVRRLIEEGQCS